MVTVLWKSFQFYFHHSKLKFIITKLYENLKLIEFNPQLNPVN